MIKVKAPASTANIGPGFDCLGAALDLSLIVEVTQQDEWPEGSSAETEDLLRKAVRLAAGEDPDIGPNIGPNIGYETRGDFPAGRGFGFSAAEVACGLLIGCVISGREPDPRELLRLGTPLEGHPDNLAAALFGGVTVALADHTVLRFDPTASVRPLILSPQERLATAEARRVLPDRVMRAEAVSNIANSSGLVALLTGAVQASAERLLSCTEDFLHQRQRAPLMPATAEVVRDLRDRGVAAAVSGAGPSVVCLVVRGEEEAVRDHTRGLEGWKLMEPDWDREGARIIER